MQTDTSIELRSAKASVLMRLGTWVVRMGPKIFPRKASEVPAFLDNRDPPKRVPVPKGFASRFDIERFELAGQQCVTLHPKGGPGKRHILYFHGGGFVLPLVKPHWDLMGSLVDTAGVSVTAALYDLVPEHPAANADRLADALFAETAKRWSPDDIALCGDSAGGHMALSLALRQVRSGGPKAGSLLLFAPWLDLTMADDAMRAIEPLDFMLAIEPLCALGEIWAEERDPASAECSPLYASEEQLAQLPPTRIFTGRHDLFIVDSRTFLKRLVEAGVNARLFEYAGAPHVFMALTATRESRDVCGLVRDFLAR